MENKRYYIKIDGRLQEVTYDEYLVYISRKVNRESVHFICMGQVVMEVEKDIYEEHYRDLRKWKYLRSEAEHWEVSYHAMDTDLMTGEETIFDETAETVEDRAMYHIYLEKLHPALEALNTEEFRLVYQLYYEGLSERTLAKQIGISQAAVHKRKEKILKCLREAMEL